MAAFGSKYIDKVCNAANSLDEQNSTNEDGITSLSSAAEHGNLEAVRRLVSLGASVDETDNKLQLSAIHNAAAHGHVDVVRYLIEQGSNPDLEDYYGATPVLHAATCGQLSAVIYLLEEARAREASYSQTPLLAAAVH